MKRVYLALSIFMMATTSVLAQAGKLQMPAAVKSATVVQKALPVVSDEPIKEAPAGQVYAGQVRKGYSFFINTNGGFYDIEHGDGFVGEYVKGDDGCIYIKDICAKARFGIYLKLDKIDDENYVAHTAQLMMPDDTGNNAFATRLVYKKMSDYSYTYQLENDADGKPITDIYFTLKDGVLKQKDQRTEVLNDVVYPHELIAYTLGDGSWFGYGDGCVEFAPVSSPKAVVPETAEVKTVTFCSNTLSSSAGSHFVNAKLLKAAEVGNELYVANPDGGADSWLKGQIDRTAGTVTFKPQYIGMNVDSTYHEWFVPATYSDYFDLWDEEDGSGSWERSYKQADELVFQYADGTVTDNDDKNTIALCKSESQFDILAAYDGISLKNYVEQFAAPANPAIVKVSPYDGWMWGSVLTNISPLDKDGNYIPEDEMYYTMYLDAETPFVFKTNDYSGLESETIDVPYALTGDGFDARGAFHRIFIFDEFEYVGIQAVRKNDAGELRSDIVWYNHTPAGIGKVAVGGNKPACVKFVKSGRLVIEKNGVKFNVAGQRE